MHQTRKALTDQLVDWLTFNEQLILPAQTKSAIQI